MSKHVLEVEDSGLHFTGDLLRQLGWQSGQQIEVSVSGGGATLRPAMTKEQFVASRAMRYLDLFVGDATSISVPREVNDHFEVDVYLSYEDVHLGKIALTPEGEIIPSLTTPTSEMQASAYAD